MQASRHHVLTPLQETVLRSSFATEMGRDDFALAGGTALAEFFLGHRVSDDLDLFGPTELVGIFADELVNIWNHDIQNLSVTSVRRSASFRRFFLGDGEAPSLQVDIGAVDPPLLSPIVRIDAINVLSADDLAVGKVLASIDRTEVKDALDLWALEAAGVNLLTVRDRALLKDPGLAAAPLTLVESITRLIDVVVRVPWPRVLIPISEEPLSTFLQRLRDQWLMAAREDMHRQSQRRRT